MDIEVIKIPGGDAPRWVRDAWIGMTLPLAEGETRARRFLSGPLLPAERGWLGMLARVMSGSGRLTLGYLVESSVALALLAQRAPEAHRWWRNHTPHLFDPGRFFVFHEYACRLRIEGPPPVNSPGA